MKISNYNRFPGGLNVGGMNVLNTYAGNVFWVDSGTGSDGNSGTYRSPLATIDTAIGKCNADSGDVIMVFPGHSETVTTSLAADVAGITIMGMGNGDNRPTLTGPSADATIDVTADNVRIANLRFTADAGTTQAATQKIYVAAAYCEIDSCEFVNGQYDDDCIYVTTAGDYADIHDNAFTVSANGPDTAVHLEGDGGALTNVKIRNNWFNGGSQTNTWDLGSVYSSGVHTHCLIEGNRFLYMSPGGIEFTAAATGVIAHNFFAGGQLGQMLDPGSCLCFENYEADAVDETGRIFPTSAAS
jgi:hypothetical protein